MLYVYPQVMIVDRFYPKEIIKKIEMAGRTCYQSYDKTTNDPSKFIQALIKRGHTSVLEHASLSFRIRCDRGCYDSTTKVLTDSGWKYFEDVDITKDKICTLDDDRNIQYVKAINKIKYHYNGLLDHYKSTQIDLAVTPDHRMWVFDYEKRSESSRTWKFIPSNHVRNGRYMFDKSSNGLCDKKCDSIIIPDVVVKRGVYDKIYKGHVFVGQEVNLFFELLGLWLTDGSLSFGTKDENGNTVSGNRISITQVKRDIYWRIVYLVNRLGIRTTNYTNEIRLSDPALFDWLVKNFIKGSNTRKTYYLTLPRWIFTDLGKYQIDCLLRGIFEGDGTTHSNKHSDSKGFVIYTASKAFAEDLVEIALLSGRTANIYTTPPRDRLFPNGYVSHCKEQYVVSFPRTDIHLFRNNENNRKMEYYDGDVYCLELEAYHRLYVMRNGKACWCGNCSHELVRHRIASYSQESTRYCKYDDDVVFIKHCMPEVWDIQEKADKQCEDTYIGMLNEGLKPEIAREALNNNLKTEVYVTMNMRSLRNFFTLRCDSHAHPYMKEIAIPFLLEMKDQLPALFGDIPYDEEFYKKYLESILDERSVVFYNYEYKCD